MEHTKNNKLAPDVTDERSVECVGLSSAMHDIRMLASQYESENASDAADSLRLSGVSVLQPQHLLQPEPTPSSDRWKGPALMLLMLLGLSTSALALGLYSKPVSLKHPVYFQTFAPTRDVQPAVELEPTRLFPREEPRHEVADDLEPTVEQRPVVAKIPRETRTSVAPKATQSVRRSVEVAESFDEYPTCDEVACLIDSSDPCCSQYASVRQQEPQLSSSKPHRPDRGSVMRTMKGIEDEVLECFTNHGESGIASVDFVIGEDGHVREVSLSHGTLDFRACVREQVRSVSFEPLQAPFRMSFPFRR